MQTPEVAIYALLTGRDQAISDLNISQSDIEASLKSLQSSKSRFFKRVKQILMEKGMKENTKITAKNYSVPEFLIIDMLRKYLNEEASTTGNTLYPFDTFDRFTQTFELPVKNWMHVASQTDLPYKVPKRSYSTQEKIEEIKKSPKGKHNAPAALIEKWKEKVSQVLFQEGHAQVYSENKKDKFCQDVDSVLVEWVKTQEKFDADSLKNKCSEMLKTEEDLVKITDNWVQAFKTFYSLG